MATVAVTILERAVRGDRDALVELLKRHGPTLRASLAGRIPKRWQAVLCDDDVLQQTFADAVAKVHQFASDSEHSFAKWLKTTARRNLRDALKMLAAEKRGGNRRRVETAPGTGSCAVSLVELITGTGTTPSGYVGSREAEAALRSAVTELPDDYARVVTLYDLEERPVEEVAQALQRSPGAVFMLRARAHDRLHEALGRASRFFDASA
jgi:RNA polymerase sigma-70 factor, ECF subfamily